MIGLIQLTDAVNADPLLINPNHISFMAASTQQLLMGLGLRSQCIPGSTVICLGNTIFQVTETIKETTSALTRLRYKQEDAMIALRKKAEREDWRGEDDEDMGETADL